MKCIFMLILLLVQACTPAPAPIRNDAHVTAAKAFTAKFARSRMSNWNVRANAAGNDCGKLLIETSVILEDSMVEALHYGSGVYDVYPGGVQRFCRDHNFRGVAYRDSSGRVWTYGAVTVAEAEAGEPCQ
jgi:hypothetical protein